MANTTTVIQVTADPSFAAIDASKGGKAALSRLINLLAGVAGGSRSGTALDVLTSAVAASGTVTLATSSGTVGATINGVSITTAFATSDTVTAAALAAAINASGNALVSGLVTASSLAGVVTITAVNKGITGNTITLAASGTGATASGARLTGGSQTRASMSL